MAKKIHLFDLLIALIMAGFFVLALFAYRAPSKSVEGEATIITVSVTRSADIVYNEASKLGIAYFNNSLEPVKVVKATKTTRNNLPAVNIELEGKGKIENDRYVFNGIRVLIGQKAEIHGRFLAQGVISNVAYKK